MKVHWNFSVEGRSINQRRPLEVGGHLVGIFNLLGRRDPSGIIHSLCQVSGEKLWEFRAEHYLSKPVASEENVIVACFDGSVYKFAPDGTVLWKVQPSESNLLGGILAGDIYIYAETGHGTYTRALDVETGATIWEFENGGHSYPATSSAGAIFHSTSLSGDKPGIVLYSLSTKGELLWKTKYPKYLFCSVIVDDLIVVGGRGCVAAFHLGSGRLLCEYSAVGHVFKIPPILLNRGSRMIFSSKEGLVVCLEFSESNKLFKFGKSVSCATVWEVNLDLRISDIEQIGELVLVMSEDGDFVEIDPSKGEVVSRKKLKQFRNGHGFCHKDGRIFVAASNNLARVEISPRD